MKNSSWWSTVHKCLRSVDIWLRFYPFFYYAVNIGWIQIFKTCTSGYNLTKYNPRHKLPNDLIKNVVDSTSAYRHEITSICLHLYSQQKATASWYKINSRKIKWEKRCFLYRNLNKSRPDRGKIFVQYLDGRCYMQFYRRWFIDRPPSRSSGRRSISPNWKITRGRPLSPSRATADSNARRAAY